jgi:CxxC-x17-CxxC domain-containing protein
MDKTLVCRECGASFVFTQGEQEFYQSRGLANPPSRCPKCRAARRAQQAGATTPPAGRPAESRPMYPATCARCGQPTQVPFQPRGDRPVYCSSCFHVERTTSITPSWAAVPSSSRPSYAELPPEEARRERRNRKAERIERGDRVRYNRRSRDYFDDEYEEGY